MNRDRTHLPGDGDQRDPVADFFAGERAEVRDLPADRGHWDELVREAQRRPARRSWLPYAGVAAAAAVVAAIAWTGVQRGAQDADPAVASSRPAPATVTSTVTVTATSTPPPASSSPGAATSSAPPRPLPVPDTFSLVSMTNAGGKHLFALGSARCGGKDCVQVVASEDDGRSWERRSAFTDLTTPGARGTPDGAHEVVGIRFATPQVGYLYGSTTKRTTDGGRTWRDVDLGSRTVLSLEAARDRVWMATAATCQGGDTKAPGCSKVEVWTAPVSGERPRLVQAVDSQGPVDAAWITMDGSDAYVSVAPVDQAAHVLPQRVSGTPRTLPRPQGCPDIGPVWVWGTANTRGGLVAVCQVHNAHADYGIATSRDRGATWSDLRITPVGGVQRAGLWLAAVDTSRLVAVVRGLPTSGPKSAGPTRLLVSGDGGATWRDTTLGGSVAWAGAAGGGLVYALSGGLSYWQSDDGGGHFTTMPMRR